jgi:ParB-like chromosome segregation protein Spo0J
MQAKTELVSIDLIQLDPANRRKHSDRNLDTIKASLRRFGQQKPIVVDRDGIVRAGNGTLTAAKALGWTEIEVRWSEAFAIADNRTAELATWDEQGLAESLRSLQSEDFDLGDVGFTDLEVADLCERLGDDLVGDDDATPPDDFAEKDESIETEYQCPSCNYAWSGKPK